MKRLIPFIAAIVILIGCLLAPFLLFRAENYRKPLTEQLSKAFHHPVLIGTLEGHYFPPHLVLHNVSVLKAGDVRYVNADEVNLSLAWSALFGKASLPDHVEISGAHLVISRLANGSWDYTDWWVAGSGGSTKTGFPDIRIKQSDMRWVDEFSTSKAEIQLKNLEGQWSSKGRTLNVSGDLGGAVAPASVNFQATGPVGLGDWSGDLKLSENGRVAAFHLRRQAGLWEVTGDAQEWRLDSAVMMARFYLRFKPMEGSGIGTSFLRNWKTQFTALGSSVTFMHNATLDGGTTELKAERVDGMPVPHVSMTAAFQNVPIPSLKPLLGVLTDGLDGKLTGVVTRFEVPLSLAAWEKTHGEFVFEVTNGSYRLPQSTLQSLKRVKTAHYLSKKFPEFEDKGFPFSKLRLQGTLADAGITLQQAGLVSGDIRAAVTGRLETETRSMDLWLQLQIHEVLPHLRHELPERYVYGESGREKIQPIFGRLQGVLSEWKLRATPRSKIPGVVQKQLKAGLAV